MDFYGLIVFGFLEITLVDPGGSADKESTCNVGDLGLIPELGRSPGEEKGYPLQFYGLQYSITFFW